MLPVEDNLHHSLFKIAPVAVVEDDIEPLPPVEVEKDKGEKEDKGKKDEKEKKGKKDKGKATTPVAPSTANVATRSATKAMVKASATPNTRGLEHLLLGLLRLLHRPLTIRL